MRNRCLCNSINQYERKSLILCIPSLQFDLLLLFPLKKISYYFKCSKAIKRSYDNVDLCFSKTKHNRTRTVLQRVQRLYTFHTMGKLLYVSVSRKHTCTGRTSTRKKKMTKFAILIWSRPGNFICLCKL